MVTRKKGNRRIRESVRRYKSQAKTAAFDPDAPWDGGFRLKLKLILAMCVLVPFGIVTTQTFFEAFATEAAGKAFWTKEEFWFFGVGFVFWLICFWGLPRPLYFYVLGHELTHYAFVKICGGRVEAWDAKAHGGYVYTDKSNTLISLSPYFVPFYTVIVGVFFVLLGFVFDLDFKYTGGPLGLSFKLQWLFLGLIGLTWGFHLTFTVWMMTKEQPDLQTNGIYFSVLLIYLANLVIICGLLIAASSAVGWWNFLSAWWDNLVWMGGAVVSFFRGIGLFFYYLFSHE